jgi:hypothetical protein
MKSRLTKSFLTLALLVAGILNVSPAFAAKKLTSGGTYIHVKNRTDKTLTFALVVECANEGTGKFDELRTVEPGQVVMWRLTGDHAVASQVKDGKTYYRVGLVGHDAAGKQYQWGVIGGEGMLGSERTSETETGTYRNILVQPVGHLSAE